MLLQRTAKRRRTVALRVLSDGTLSVQAPLRTSLKWIEAFVASRAGWIEKRRVERAKEAEKAPVLLTEGMELPFLDTPLTLKIEASVPMHPPFDPQEGSLTLFLPEGLTEEERRAEIRTELILWYKKKARALFAERLAFWSSVMKLAPSRLVVTAPERRWGSCNAKNEIRLNWRLIMGKAAWLDYVIVHELAHIPHKNHGARFWRRVEAALPAFRQSRQELQNWKGENWLER